jgi:hypothetical protein
VLRFGATQALRFRIVDGAGKPIAGASVRIGSGGGGVEAELSDANGYVGALQSAPPADEVEAEAPGYISARHPIAPAAATGQELVLQLASSVTLIGTEAPPDGWGALDAEFVFRAKEDASSLTRHTFQPGRFEEGGGSTWISSSGDEMRYSLKTSFSDAGRVVLDGIHADVPVHVTVRYRGHPLYDDRVPIRPGDGAHEVRMPPLPALVPLGGIAEDATGAPLPGVAASAGGAKAVSGADGRFDLGLVAVGSVNQVLLEKRGYARKSVGHVAAAGDALPLGRVRMEAGLSLVVQVLGPDGAPYVPVPGSRGTDARPVLEVFGETVEPVQAGSGAATEYRFEDLPAGAFACWLQADWMEIGGRTTLDSAHPRATLTLSAADLELLNAEP